MNEILGDLLVSATENLETVQDAVTESGGKPTPREAAALAQLQSAVAQAAALASIAASLERITALAGASRKKGGKEV